METPPRSLMASYLERWEEQKAQSRRERERQARRRSSDVGDELSFISAIEREAAQQEQRSANVDAPERKWEEREVDSFDLPAMDAFPPSSFAQEGQEVLQPTALPAEEEFVDAATFLKQNELGEEDSFSQDVGEFLNGNWEQNTSGRPSDFFEKKSRNMEHVELSSPRQVDDFFGDVDAEKTEGEKLESLIPQEEGSPVDPQQGAALHDRLDRSSGLSGSGTALSSGYDVHFDNARLVYTPNTLKHLQEKSRARNTSETWRNDKSIDKAVNYTSDAKDATQYPPFPVEQNIPEDISPKYVVALQRGPGVIKEALNEIDALIDASSRSAEEPSLGVDLSEDMREFVRAYELPLESMLPLSRTTDSWGEDVSVSQVEDDMNRRSRELGRLSSGTDSRRPTLNGVSRSRSQETPELDTIRETTIDLRWRLNLLRCPGDVGDFFALWVTL
ncbi:hypothetical protein PHYBOEH_000058 [Phytophthora boehmeriae]|uniref:Uncharacterized protein n=1 Tax=Phytophthora boehmeriae TaxID=109152 RepID=A0A8T1XGA5_9STRA|nr:hypothetical protein PHYBOEH_000058 [Phytophthora boehmeriae]